MPQIKPTEDNQTNQKDVIILQGVMAKKQISWIFNILQFSLCFNYAIENALITMLMISFLTPDIIDSLIWIIPNILSILIRPYFIRFAQNKNLTIYNQVKIIFYLMLIACIGSSLVGYSTSLTTKNFSFRILICTIGWTISGVCFDLVTFFADKLKTNIKERCYFKNKSLEKIQNGKSNQQINQIFDFQNSQTFLNFELIGYTLGYLIIFGIFLLKYSPNMKAFYSGTKLLYIINSAVTLISAFGFYLVSKINLPSEDPQAKRRMVPFKLSYDANYYIPGYSQLLSSSFKTFQYLFVHFVMYFLVDIVTIYCTMWITNSIESSEMKLSQSYFFGIRYGVIFLLMFTYVNLTSIFDYFLDKVSFQKMSLIVSLCGVLCWSLFNLVSFLVFVVSVSLLFRKYNKTVQDRLKQNCKIFQTCKQIVQRFGKIFVLCHMPFTIMILLGRDDIQDGILWGSVLIALTFLTLSFKLKLQHKIQEKEVVSTQKKQKQN